MRQRSMTILAAMTAVMFVCGSVAVAQPDGGSPPPRDEQYREGGPQRGSWRGGDRPMMRGGDRRYGHDGDRDRSGPPGDQDHGYRLTEEQSAQVLEVLEDYRPEMAEQIREMQQRDPQRAEQLLRRAMMFVRHMVHMKQSDPDGYALELRDAKLDRESHELARQLRRAEGDEATRLRAQLREAVAAHFDVRQQIRERKLAMLEKRVEELRGQIEERAQARNELVDQRFGDLVGAGDEPEW